MRRTLESLVLALLAAAPSAAARVELAPETVSLSPAAPSAAAAAMVLPAAAAPSLLSPSIAAAPSAAPLAAPAAALAPAPLAPAAAVPLAAARPAPALAPSARAESRPALTTTLGAAQPEFSKMSGGESAAEAEKDFARRAQLGEPSSDGATALAAAFVPEPGPRHLRLLKPAAAAPRAAPAPGSLAAFGGLDHDGALLRAARAALAERPAGAAIVLNFTPTPGSLRALGEADGVLLARGRADGRWRLVNAGAAGFSAASDDFDFAVLGRASGSGAPTGADLSASEGRAARFAIASKGGLHEWNADMPEGAGRAFEASSWSRALARLAGPLATRVLAFHGVASERRAWGAVGQDRLDDGRGPLAERQLAGTVIPEWMRAELPVAAAKLGLKLSAAEEADVLARSKVWVYTWHSRWTYEVPGGLPDGHFDRKFGIRVMLKTDWRRLKDPETHFRVLFAHEYTHWLQDAGLVTYRFGIEIPAVAVEQLRAMELVGWEGMKAGRVGFIAEGNLASFESGRAWARGDMADKTALMYRGVLGGAAYEVGVIAGRPEAAWEFLNLVVAEKGALEPREAFERVTGLKAGSR